MKLLLKLFVAAFAFAALSSHADDEKPKPSGDRPGSINSAGTKAAKAMEKAGDRGAKAAIGGLDTAGKWVGKGGERVGKAMGHAGDKTNDWVKKKTE